jgi:hypothetical protein
MWLTGKLIRATLPPMPKSKPNPWGWRLWLVTCLLFLLVAWQQPAKRGVSLSVAAVFGIIAVGQRLKKSE